MIKRALPYLLVILLPGGFVISAALFAWGYWKGRRT